MLYIGISTNHNGWLRRFKSADFFFLVWLRHVFSCYVRFKMRCLRPDVKFRLDIDTSPDSVSIFFHRIFLRGQDLHRALQHCNQGVARMHFTDPHTLSQAWIEQCLPSGSLLQSQDHAREARTNPLHNHFLHDQSCGSRAPSGKRV